MQSSSSETPTRRALHERSQSQTNIRGTVRVVPYTPPRLQSDGDNLYARTALPTHPAHFFPPAPSASVAHPGVSIASENHIYAQKSAAQSRSSVPEAQPSTPADVSRPTTATSTSSKRLPKKRKQVALNPDNKTFRVLDVQQDDEVETDTRAGSQSLGPSLSPQSLSTRASKPSASKYQDSIDATTVGTSSLSDSAPITTDPSASSPWNYRFVGGLRKVAATPDLRGGSQAPSWPNSPAPTVQALLEDPEQGHELSPQSSFQSPLARSNYEIFGSSPSPSSPAIAPASLSESITSSRQDLPDLPGRERSNTAFSSTAESTDRAPGVSSRAPSEMDSTSRNFWIHDNSSQVALDMIPASSVGPSYSQESLVVAPLRPKSKRSTEKFGYYKSRSRENLRRHGSLASIPSTLSAETAQGSSTVGALGYGTPGGLINMPNLWAAVSANASRFPMQPLQHQWSSHLSTVPSESEGGTERASRTWSDVLGRSSSGITSFHSRQVPSRGSLRLDEEVSGIYAVERPQAAYTRSPPILVEDQDEYGDGITDLQDLRTRPSRTRLSELYNLTSELSRTGTMQSTSSSRSNSLVAGSIPAWARIYYGSGERRYLAHAGSRNQSIDDAGSRRSRYQSIDEGGSQPHSSLRTGSPAPSNFPETIYSPRRRPREFEASPAQPVSNRGDSLEITSTRGSGMYASLRHKYSFPRLRPPSSIFSAHLQRDKRPSRPSQFFLQPASAVWSADGTLLTSRRKRLIFMFALGFIFPFAWMIGAFLPLPPDPSTAIAANEEEVVGYDRAKALVREKYITDEVRYESARWWRTLNRGMAVVGTVLMIVIIILVALGVTQHL